MKASRPAIAATWPIQKRTPERSRATSTRSPEISVVKWRSKRASAVFTTSSVHPARSEAAQETSPHPVTTSHDDGAIVVRASQAQIFVKALAETRKTLRISFRGRVGPIQLFEAPDLLVRQRQRDRRDLIFEVL